jgi:hypothetical protein
MEQFLFFFFGAFTVLFLVTVFFVVWLIRTIKELKADIHWLRQSYDNLDRAHILRTQDLDQRIHYAVTTSNQSVEEKGRDLDDRIDNVVRMLESRYETTNRLIDDIRNNR